MGRAKLRLTRLELLDFSKGYFPNKDFDDIPKGGSSDCRHVIYYQSALRKMFGMDLVNAAQAATLRGNGLFYLDVLGTTARAAVFGTGFYEDVAGVWTARTGAVTITDAAANLWQFINHQQGANRFLIGVNGVDVPIKWTGAGNAAVLAGSPQIFTSIAQYHNTTFGSIQENVDYSDTGDPETWNSTKWRIPFEKTVTRVINHGQKLAVFMADRTASISGFDYLDFVAEHSEIPNVGCVGRLAACNAFFGKNKIPVIATVSKDGVWLIDQSFGTTKLFGDEFFFDFNQANLSKSVCAYSDIDRLLYVALPKDSTECDYLMVVDMETGALWPCSSIHTNSIRSMASCRDNNGNEFIYFVDTNGYAFKFNRVTTNYHTGTATQAIDARWKSRKYDLKDVHQMRWPMLLADADGDWNVTMSLAFGLTAADGTTGTINLQDDSDLLGTTFAFGASALGGSDYVFKTAAIGGFGRFLAVSFSNAVLSQSFNIKKCELQLKRRRMGGNDK